MTAPELFQLTRDTCMALLTTQHVGRLVVAGDDPIIVPVNYAVVDDTIMFRTDRGSRVGAIVQRAVVFEVDMFDDRTKSGWSVILRGAAIEIEANDDAGAAATGHVVQPWAPGPKDCWIMITAEHVSGRLLRGEVDSVWVNDRAYL